MVRRAIADAACSIYAIESMIYMTASIPDLYEKPDIDLESAIVKVFITSFHIKTQKEICMILQ